MDLDDRLRRLSAVQSDLPSAFASFALNDPHALHTRAWRLIEDCSFRLGDRCVFLLSLFFFICRFAGIGH